MRAFFRKRTKYLNIWVKMYKILKYFERGQPHRTQLFHATIARMKQLEYAQRYSTVRLRLLIFFAYQFS